MTFKEERYADGVRYLKDGAEIYRKKGGYGELDPDIVEAILEEANISTPAKEAFAFLFASRNSEAVADEDGGLRPLPER